MKKNPNENLSLELELKQKSSNVQLSFSKKLPEIPAFRQSPAPSLDEKRSLKPAGKENKYDGHVIDKIYSGPLEKTTDQTKIDSWEETLQGYVDLYSDIRIMVPMIYKFSRNNAQMCQNLLLASTGQQNSVKDNYRVKILNNLYTDSYSVKFVLELIVGLLSYIDFKSFRLIMENIYQYRTARLKGAPPRATSKMIITPELKSEVQRLQSLLRGSQTSPPNPDKPAPYHGNRHLITNENNRKAVKLTRSRSLSALNSKPGVLNGQIINLNSVESANNLPKLVSSADSMSVSSSSSSISSELKYEKTTVSVSASKSSPVSSSVSSELKLDAFKKELKALLKEEYRFSIKRSSTDTLLIEFDPKSEAKGSPETIQEKLKKLIDSLKSAIAEKDIKEDQYEMIELEEEKLTIKEKVPKVLNRIAELLEHAGRPEKGTSYFQEPLSQVKTSLFGSKRSKAVGPSGSEPEPAISCLMQ